MKFLHAKTNRGYEFRFVKIIIVNSRINNYLIMSRSYKKSPFSWFTTAVTEKQDKRDANRKYRRTVKHLLQKGIYYMPLERELSNVYCFDKDGKFYDLKKDPKSMRK